MKSFFYSPEIAFLGFPKENPEPAARSNIFIGFNGFNSPSHNSSFNVKLSPKTSIYVLSGMVLINGTVLKAIQ